MLIKEFVLISLLNLGTFANTWLLNCKRNIDWIDSPWSCPVKVCFDNKDIRLFVPGCTVSSTYIQLYVYSFGGDILSLNPFKAIIVTIKASLHGFTMIVSYLRKLRANGTFSFEGKDVQQQY